MATGAFAAAYRKHGGVSKGHRPELFAWRDMLRRCHDPQHGSFHRYGARGIRVCDRWRSDFAVFLADIGPRPPGGYSLDRIDNAKGYEPGNVRWATTKQQMRNQRGNRLLTIGAETLCLIEWSERSGIDPRTLDGRLRRGWPTERAVFAPAGSRRGAA